MAKKLFKLAIDFICVLIIFGSYLMLNFPKITAAASSNIDMQDINDYQESNISKMTDSGVENNIETLDNDILQYYHEPDIKENFEDNVVNVILKSDFSGEISFADFKEIASEIFSITYKLKTIYKGNGEKLTTDINENSILTLKLYKNDKANVLKVINKLQNIDIVLVAEPNYIYETISDWIPNDELYKYQWALNGIYGIQAEDAWDITTGSDAVKVGIFENGADSNHPDLNERIFSGNISGSDDHGTAVAGIISGIQCNYGIAGISQSPIYLLSKSKFVSSLAYATENGIKIINASFHFTTNGYYAEYNATYYAAIKNYDGLLVCAAGNDKIDTDATPIYPACYDLPNVISVGSIDDTNYKSSFSNYGKDTVHLYAPGSDILTDYPISLCEKGTCNKGLHIFDGYHLMDGTSFAAPHVTGVAALLLSQYPTLTATELKDAIVGNADDITISTPDGDQNVKKLNAYKALTLYDNVYTVTLHYNDEYIEYTRQVNVKYGEQMPNPFYNHAPVHTGYEFVGFFSGEDGSGTQYYSMELKTEPTPELCDRYYESIVPINTWDHFSDGDLYVCWKLLECDFTYLNIKLNEGYFDEQSTVHLVHGEEVKITAKTFSGYKFSYFDRGGKIYTTSTVTWDMKLVRSEADGTIIPKDYFFAVYEKNCVAEGTLITLADGEQVPVEQLKGDEMLLVWNLYTGTFDSAPILFIDSDPASLYEVINLYFSDGTVVKVISEHAFWDFDLNEYIYLDENAAEYIGHWFNKQSTNENGELSWTRVQLSDVIIQEEYTTAWSPVTYGHLCYYVNGMLSMPGGIDGLFNIFEVDGETLTYNSESMAKDIEQYGLFTYEEFAEILPVPEEIFNAFSGQYLKVAIGKGLIDFETLTHLVERYQKFF